MCGFHYPSPPPGEGGELGMGGCGSLEKREGTKEKAVQMNHVGWRNPGNMCRRTVQNPPKSKPQVRVYDRWATEKEDSDDSKISLFVVVGMASRGPMFTGTRLPGTAWWWRGWTVILMSQWGRQGSTRCSPCTLNGLRINAGKNFWKGRFIWSIRDGTRETCSNTHKEPTAITLPSYILKYSLYGGQPPLSHTFLSMNYG